MRFADLDAVTIDCYGTLLRLVDPLPDLRAALASHGISRDDREIAAAFRAEVAYYRPRSLEGRDPAGLEDLRVRCAAVFLATLDATLDAAAFAPSFVAALRFEPLPGALETVESLHRRGLKLAVVANWDCALRGHLERLGIAGRFDVVVSSAEAGVEKPAPAIFHHALALLGTSAARALHVGDEPADELGAAAAGMQFRPAPLATAFAGWA